MNCIVTDIDGTICEGTTTDGFENWEKRLYEKPPKPIIPMRTMLQAAAAGGLYILYATARRQVLENLTTTWLKQYAFPQPSRLLMRPDDLRLSQDVLKMRYLKDIRNTGWNPVVWFEDNVETVKALRAAGVHAITC